MRVIFSLGLMLLLARNVSAHSGGAAVPADVRSHWNFEPLILFALLASLYLFLRGAATYRVAGWRTACFAAGLGALFVALISPLDAISAALFSGHMIQHLLLVLVAAPCLIVSRPFAPLLRGLPLASRKSLGGLVNTPVVQSSWSWLSRPVPVSVLHVGVLWGWHLPGLYGAAFDSPFIHAVQHISFVVTALLFWWAIFHAESYDMRVLCVFATMMTTGLLGALMTFARSPWYNVHQNYTGEWGLTLLQDQQLAGLLMWLPPGIVYVIVAGLLLTQWLNAVEAKVLKRERQWLEEVNDA
jgi:cytochrome c oxidase assembly factor CtaG